MVYLVPDCGEGFIDRCHHLGDVYSKELDTPSRQPRLQMLLRETRGSPDEDYRYWQIEMNLGERHLQRNPTHNYHIVEKPLLLGVLLHALSDPREHIIAPGTLLYAMNAGDRLAGTYLERLSREVQLCPTDYLGSSDDLEKVLAENICQSGNLFGAGVTPEDVDEINRIIHFNLPGGTRSTPVL